METDSIYTGLQKPSEDVYSTVNQPQGKRAGEQHGANMTVKKASSWKWAAVGLAVLCILSVSVPLGVIFHRNAEYASLFQKYSDLQNHLKNSTDMTENCSAVWKWILGAAVDVTLDPDTAHPRLTLSAEGKRVRLGVQDWERDSIGGPVCWAGRASPRGDATGRCSLKPQKLGVYLDYEEGQLSFYNVESRSHIYTFTDMEFNPNEKLYPFFYTGDSDTALVLESPDPDPVSAAD
ncbi:E3 ubiquitin-protein ligase TRIM39-like [Polyodon spathula]|uniref:E3 ubiquitin-protein ligase TRIM39-like n=1 Tax=Polyodon spathula TaxID=7913 RepID=UPI001B7F33ED|nr:E3 ubiquitin-protein ligase TRIM39-like [Polyodon spathula]